MTVLRRKALGAVLLILSCSAALAEDNLLDAVVQYRVEALGPSGETRITSAVAVRLSPQGLLLTTASPFEQARAAKQVRILVTSGKESARYIRPLELVFVDMPANIAVLRAQGDRGGAVAGLSLPQQPVDIKLGTAYRTVRFVLGTDGVVLPHTVDLPLVGPNRFSPSKAAPLGTGSPVVAADGTLVGLVSTFDLNGTVGILPISLDVLPPSAATAITGLPSVADAVGAGQTKVTFQLSETQNTHVAGATLREYQKNFPAPAGSKIVDVSISVASANHVRNGPSVRISNDGKMASVHYSIESGPLWDQWRGWLHGDVYLTLVPER